MSFLALVWSLGPPLLIPPEEEVVELLRKGGEYFWGCRDRFEISYNGV
jgi:hypothetical protein